MNKAELQEYLADTSERNPFIKVEHGQRGSLTGKETWGGDEFPSDIRNSLYRHLANQFPLVFDSDRDMQIALAFLQEIEPSGWLSAPVERIAEINGFEPSESQSVLDRLQTLEPAGVFARDLKECLRLQAIDRDLLDDVMETVLANLDQLMTCDVVTLARRLKIDPPEFSRRLAHIRRMDPKPGSVFFFDEIARCGSDVELVVTDQEITFELSQSSFPSVQLSLASEADGQVKSSHHTALNNLVHEAKALRTAVDMRKSTTLSVLAAIFARQTDFLAHGYVALSPMRLSDIANDIGVSEATVSRVLSGLTIQCPRGVVSAKSLFCSPVPYCDKPQTKHVALQMINDLIADEDKKSPLSDQKITCLIQKSGLGISRRTVTKYRQSLGLDTPGIRRKSVELAEFACHARGLDVGAGRGVETKP